MKDKFEKMLKIAPPRLYIANPRNPSPFLNYEQFLNEVKIEPREIDYEYAMHNSIGFKGKRDFIIHFSIEDHKYVLIFYYYECNGRESYDILITTYEAYDVYTKKLNTILKKGQGISDDEYKELVDVVEKLTHFNEPNQVMNAVSYIIFKFIDVIHIFEPGIELSITETNDPRKIRSDRGIIKLSFPNVVETEGLNTDGKKIYYYKINK
jgi:hypothetical protein